MKKHEIVMITFTTLFVRSSESRRTRQKLQQHHPELCGCDEVEAYRVVNEERFKNYARGIV